MCKQPAWHNGITGSNSPDNGTNFLSSSHLAALPTQKYVMSQTLSRPLFLSGKRVKHSRTHMLTPEGRRTCQLSITGHQCRQRTLRLSSAIFPLPRLISMELSISFLRSHSERCSKIKHVNGKNNSLLVPGPKWPENHIGEKVFSLRPKGSCLVPS